MAESNNPKLVIDTIIDAPTTFGDVTINDITILRYAYLEKINSPFIDASVEFKVDNIVPTVFVLAIDKNELRKYSNDIEALKADALEWADEKLKLDQFAEIISCISNKFLALNKAAPSGAESKKN